MQEGIPNIIEIYNEAPRKELVCNSTSKSMQHIAATIFSVMEMGHNSRFRLNLTDSSLHARVSSDISNHLLGSSFSLTCTFIGHPSVKQTRAVVHYVVEYSTHTFVHSLAKSTYHSKFAFKSSSYITT